MNIQTNYYINRNTGNLTTNLKNTIIQDKDRAEKLRKYCAFGIEEVESALDRIEANIADLPYKGQTKYDMNTNSINYGKGATIRLNSGYSIELGSNGWFVNYGDINDTETNYYSQTLAENMTNLLKYAEHQFKYPTSQKSELEAWSKAVLTGLNKSGINTSKPFTVNGMEFVVDDGIVKSTESIKAENEALEAYKLSLIQNKTFNFCTDDMKENIDYYFKYYCENVPNEFKDIWYQTMQECNVNPFASNSSAVPRMSYEKDELTGGNKDLFGNTMETARQGVVGLIAYLDTHTSMDEQFDSRQREFFEKLLEKIK